jgi:hypothetical protein
VRIHPELAAEIGRVMRLARSVPLRFSKVQSCSVGAATLERAMMHRRFVRASRRKLMNRKDKDRLPPDQLLEEVAKKGDRAGVPDETVRREASKPRESSPEGGPKEEPPKKS